MRKHNPYNINCSLKNSGPVCDCPTIGDELDKFTLRCVCSSCNESFLLKRCNLDERGRIIDKIVTHDTSTLDGSIYCLDIDCPHCGFSHHFGESE